MTKSDLLTLMQRGKAPQQKERGKHFVRFRFLLKDSEGTSKGMGISSVVCAVSVVCLREEANQGLGTAMRGG